MARVRSLVLACAAAAAGQPLPPSEPDLDLPPGSEAHAVLRRAQSRAGYVLPAQAFPQPARAAAAWLDSLGPFPFDAGYLRHRLPGARREAVAWSDSARGNSFFLSPSAEAGYDRAFGGDGDSAGWSFLNGLGATVHGRFAGRLAFYSRGGVYTERTDCPRFAHQFSPDLGETYAVEKGPGDSLLPDRTFNRYEAYLRLDLDRLSLKAGRDRLHMGPGYFSSLTATRDTPPYYLLEARVDFAPWLRVDDYLIRMTDTRHSVRKYANLHRFEFTPWRGLSLAFQDIVIYQDRGPDWRYALPLVPLAFAEDNLGGEDNDAMACDFLWAALPGVSAWGELFIDDLLSPGAFFDDFWENRWAALAGFQAASPWPAVDADLVVEFTRVEPWTYIGRSAQTSFKHFDRPSASRLGPDSRSWDIQASWRPLPWLEWKERLALLDRGLGRQAALGAVHDDAVDGTTKEWLGGAVRSERILRHDVTAYWGQWLKVSAFYDQVLDGPSADRTGMHALAAW